tara:strand:+ start:413 stop:628 length:216 start_codon:yes stop_codon:yes gene_type:complete
MKQSKPSKPSQLSDRFKFERFRDEKVKIDKEGKEGKEEKFVLTEAQRIKANYLWGNKTTNLYKIKAKLKKD